MFSVLFILFISVYFSKVRAFCENNGTEYGYTLCYIYADIGPHSYEIAEKYCKNYEANVIDIDSPETQNYFQENLPKKYFYIALKKESGQWSHEKVTLASEEQVNVTEEFLNWEDSEPRDGKDCAMFLPITGRWKSVPCYFNNAVDTVVCTYPSNSSNPPLQTGLCYLSADVIRENGKQLYRTLVNKVALVTPGEKQIKMCNILNRMSEALINVGDKLGLFTGRQTLDLMYNLVPKNELNVLMIEERGRTVGEFYECAAGSQLCDFTLGTINELGSTVNKSLYTVVEYPSGRELLVQVIGNIETINNDATVNSVEKVKKIVDELHTLYGRLSSDQRNVFNAIALKKFAFGTLADFMNCAASVTICSLTGELVGDAVVVDDSVIEAALKKVCPTNARQEATPCGPGNNMSGIIKGIHEILYNSEKRQAKMNRISAFMARNLDFSSDLGELVLNQEIEGFGKFQELLDCAEKSKCETVEAVVAGDSWLPKELGEIAKRDDVDDTSKMFIGFIIQAVDECIRSTDTFEEKIKMIRDYMEQLVANAPAVKDRVLSTYIENFGTIGLFLECTAPEQ